MNIKIEFLQLNLLESLKSKKKKKAGNGYFSLYYIISVE